MKHLVRIVLGKAIQQPALGADDEFFCVTGLDIPQHPRGTLDRIGKAQNFLGSMLSVKPLLTVKDGEVHPLTRVRSRVAGMEYLHDFVTGFPRIEELAIEHATTPDEADELAESLGSIFPKEQIYKSTVSPVIGTYVGPQVLSVSVLEASGS